MASRPGRGPSGRGGRAPRSSPSAVRRGGVDDQPLSEAEAPPDAESAGTSLLASRFTGRALVLLLVVAVLGVSYASSIRAWLNQRNEQATLSSQIAAERAQIAQLRLAKARWNDPAYIEAQARLRFGWVLPGERSYRVIGKDGKVLSAGQGRLSTGVPGARPAAAPWWQGTVDSLVEAGSPPVQTKKKQQQPTRRPATVIGPAGPRAPGR